MLLEHHLDRLETKASAWPWKPAIPGETVAIFRESVGVIDTGRGDRSLSRAPVLNGEQPKVLTTLAGEFQGIVTILGTGGGITKIG